MDKEVKIKVDQILKKSHLIINDATGLDIPKSESDKAQAASKKVLKELKVLAPEIYNIVKEEFNG